MLARAFDRPAFRTPFQQESNLPAFLQAVEDTIRVLSTGIWQTREGVEIHRLPSLHHIRDPSVRSALEATVRELDHLRRRYKTLLSTGAIRPCGCGDPSCPTFMGHSLSEVDAPYLEEITKHIDATTVTWKVSYHSNPAAAQAPMSELGIDPGLISLARLIDF